MLLCCMLLLQGVQPNNIILIFALQRTMQGLQASGVRTEARMGVSQRHQTRCWGRHLWWVVLEYSTRMVPSSC